MVSSFYRNKDTVIARTFIVFFAILPFSYFPTISLGVYAGMHIDISLIYLALACTAMVCAALTPLSVYKDNLKSYRKPPQMILLGLTLYGLYAVASTLWSANMIKGAVTAIYLCLILFVVVSLYVHRSILTRHTRQIALAFGATLTLAVIFGYWQALADAFGLSSVWIQLPAPYQSTVFGFARPTGFSLEPQFFGSILVPAVVYFSYRIVFHPATTPRYWEHLLFVLFFAMTLMTLSRGAIFSLAISSLLLLVVGAAHGSARRTRVLASYIRYLGLVVVSIGLSCSAIMLAAHSNTRDDIGGTRAVVNYVNQLSLGTVAIDLPKPPVPAQPAPSTPAPQTLQLSTPAPGYVEESTNSRLLMSKTALKLWSETPFTAIAGVGFGGYGVAAHARDPSLVSHSIVNNYYLEVLVETGIIGLALLVGSLGYLGVHLLRRQSVVLFSILVAIAVQMLFYSGNANTIHVWMCIGLCIVSLSALHDFGESTKKDTTSPTLGV